MSNAFWPWGFGDPHAEPAVGAAYSGAEGRGWLTVGYSCAGWPMVYPAANREGRSDGSGPGPRTSNSSALP